MAAAKSTGVTGGERRRKPRAAAATGLADGEWLGRLDALADQLAGLDDRGTIIEYVVSETMKLLPADHVVVRADDDDALTAPLFTEENDGVPARAVIPLAIAGRRFGAVEIAMKPSRTVGPGERTLSIALARQCALALDSLAMRKAQREGLLAESVHAPVDETMIESSAPVEVTPVPVEVTPVPVDPTPAPLFAPATDVTAVQATIARLEADLRALAKLARSAELPPTAWVDQAERKALRDLEELRAQLPGAENAA
jgi:hypothetical protein